MNVSVRIYLYFCIYKIINKYTLVEIRKLYIYAYKWTIYTLLTYTSYKYTVYENALYIYIVTIYVCIIYTPYIYMYIYTLYIYIYIYIYIPLRKTKSGHFRIINLFPSCYEFWYESITSNLTGILQILMDIMNTTRMGTGGKDMTWWGEEG